MTHTLQLNGFCREDKRSMEECVRALQIELAHYQHKAQLSGDLAESQKDRAERAEAELANIKEGGDAWIPCPCSACQEDRCGTCDEDGCAECFRRQSDAMQARLAEAERRMRGHHPSDHAQESCFVCTGQYLSRNPDDERECEG